MGVVRIIDLGGKSNVPGQRPPLSAEHKGEGEVVVRKRWTLAEIERMSAAEYAENLKDANFVAAVDALGQPAEPPVTQEPKSNE